MKFLVLVVSLLGAFSRVEITQSGSLPKIALESIKQHLSKLDLDCKVQISVEDSKTPGKAFSFETSGNKITVKAESGMYQTYAVYHLLEEVFGFSFLHPLETARSSSNYCSLSEIEAVDLPHWEVRGMHIHTEHPLMHVELLNGFGKFPSTENWEDQLWEWNKVLEWCIANRLNYVEWVLLKDQTWIEYSESKSRQEKLSKLVDMAHGWGIKVGIDTPIAMIQQHAFALIRNNDNPLGQIEKRLEYLRGAGFDYISSEMGTTEFTHGSATDMLKWLNHSTTYSNKIGMDFYTKVHCSKGQNLKNFVNPLTNETGMDYNFLPYYAVEELGILPHTVEFYSLEDPAPVYGNTNFSYILDFMMLEADKRNTIWFPETAYWITFDVNVPLFLPIYAENRIKDVHKIVQKEKEKNVKLQGQIFFESGWEFGYWLSNVITARLSWNPLIDSKDPLSDALKPFTRVLGHNGDQVGDLIKEVVKVQADTLIYGKVDGKAPSNPKYLTGMAYLEGYDTVMDLAYFASLFIDPGIAVMPNRVPPVLVRHGLEHFLGIGYETQVLPLLNYQSRVYSELSTKLGSLQVSQNQNWLLEIQDSLEIFAKRAEFNALLYSYAHKLYIRDSTGDLLSEMLSLLNSTQDIVNRRVENFKVPAERITSWRPNPTGYCYTYLWTAKTLYYWWRDLLMVHYNHLSPCYYNIRDMVYEEFGSGLFLDAEHFFYKVFGIFSINDWFDECLGCPKEAPLLANLI